MFHTFKHQNVISHALKLHSLIYALLHTSKPQRRILPCKCGLTLDGVIE